LSRSEKFLDEGRGFEEHHNTPVNSNILRKRIDSVNSHINKKSTTIQVLLNLPPVQHQK